MDQATRDFLLWLDAYCENIDKVPNAKQWNRIMARIAEMGTHARSAPAQVVNGTAVGHVAELAGHDAELTVSVPHDPAREPTAEEIEAQVAASLARANNTAPAAEVKPSNAVILTNGARPTPAMWKAQYRQKMKQLGLEGDDLNDFVKLAVVNVHIDASKQAAADYNHLFPGTNAA